MRYLKKQEVLDITGLSCGSLRNLLKRDEFPRPRQITPRRIGYLDADVYEWMESRPATIPQEQPKQFRASEDDGAGA